jgi:hypothetical protein
LISIALLAGCSDRPQPYFTYKGKEVAALASETEAYVPKAGMVPSARTAATMAEAVAEGIWGEQTIRNERPYEVTDTPAHWIVRGSLPEGWKGGVFEVVLQKRDGAVVSASHGE